MTGVDSIRDVIVATHYWSPGWASALDEYLRPRAPRYRWIGHPLFADGSLATYRHYERGRLVDSDEVSGVSGPSRYAADIRRTIRWAHRAGPTELFIAGDNLIAMAGLWLRRRGFARGVVLYTIDYVPNRFSNALANRAYHGIDRFASRRADVVWNTASGIIEARQQRDRGHKTAPQLVVPIGAHTRRIAAQANSEARAPVIAYLGHLLEKQGLQVVIAALPQILRAAPDAKLLVIGDGPYRPQLESLARAMKVEGAIEFAGFSDDHAQIERRLLRCSLGVAPYVPGSDNYSQFQDLPGKIVTYLACGLPVFTTEVPRHGDVVQKAGAGKVVAYDKDIVASSIIDVLTHPDRLAAMREAAISLGQSYDWDDIFDRALADTVRLTPALGRT